MSYRPLALICGLTVGDYLLWNWSLNTNHEVIALVSGLTLPPLALVALWQIVLAVGRLLSASADRRRRRAVQQFAMASRGVPVSGAESSRGASAPTGRSGKLAA